MGEVSVLGLGAMGSALATGLVGAGQRVTLWNRTASKADTLAGRGAIIAESAADAIAASPVVIVCLPDYDITQVVLSTASTELPGRTVVQLSTGAPTEAERSSEWVHNQRASYLDGAILAFPDNITTEEAMFLLSGDEDAYQAAEPLLRILAPTLEYLGPQPQAASAVDCAILSVAAGVLLGTAHAIRIAREEGVIDSFGRVMEFVAPFFPDDMTNMIDVARTGSYSDPRASTATWLGVMERLVRQSADRGIDSEFPAFVRSVFDRAVREGRGQDDPASLASL